MIDLTAAGLSAKEANCYNLLLSKAEWRPAELAKEIGESRSNCYKLLDKLAEYKLAEKFDKNKKIHFRAANPAQLMQLAHEKKAAQQTAESELELNVHGLLKEYVKNQEQAGVRFFEGKEDLKNIYTEQAGQKEPIYFIHTLAGIDFYGFNHMHDLRMMTVKAGVPRQALTPDTEKATLNWQETDEKFLLKRTWLDEDDYTAPVEWGAYGDKLYIISFGTEATGMIIESKQIAEAFKQLFKLLDRGQKLQPDYSKLPKLARAKAKVF